MHTFNVYLIKSQRRLVILKESVDNDDYYLLMNIYCTNESAGKYSADSYCCGYISGNSGLKVINSLNEFGNVNH